MKDIIYFDNSATTELCEAAKKKIGEVAESIYGNPSSLHSAGLAAEKQLSLARENILRALGESRADSSSLVFTGSGTEANNLAIFGSIRAKKYPEGSVVVTTDSEHPSVEVPLEKLGEAGYSVLRVPTKKGRLDLEFLKANLSNRIVLATMMLVNNETGAIYDIANAFETIKQTVPFAVTHCDATQAFLKIPFSPSALKADLVTISGHKVHAPKGVGALYVNKEILKAKKIVPYIYGGGQENGLRSGTENVMGIAAFGEAVSYVYSQKENIIRNISMVKQHILERIQKSPILKDVVVNLPEQSVPHIISLTMPNIKSEVLLNFMALHRIYISSGSACSSHAKHRSSVLPNFGLTSKQADCTVRVSLGMNNTLDDADCFADVLEKAVSKLARMK